MVPCATAHSFSWPFCTTKTSQRQTAWDLPVCTACARDQPLADRRAQVVDLEFGGDHRHQQRGAAGVSQRIVGRVADHATMHKAVLLLDAVPDRDLQFAASGRQRGELGPDQLRKGLRGQHLSPHRQERLRVAVCISHLCVLQNFKHTRSAHAAANAHGHANPLGAAALAFNQRVASQALA